MIYSAILALTCYAAVQVESITGDGFNVNVYIDDQQTATMPVHFFAVGSTFSHTDYTAWGTELAKKGVVTAVFDYQSGAVFKTAKKFHRNYPVALKQFRELATAWQSKYNVHINTLDSAIFVGGHSNGGDAVFHWASSHPLEYGGMVMWDPVVKDTKFPFTLPKGVNALISYPPESGCKVQINEKNDGYQFYTKSQPSTQLILHPYHNVAHNSMASDGFLGKMTCYKKVDSFFPEIAARVATFILSGGDVAEYKKEYNLE